MTLGDVPAICGEEIPHFFVFDFSTAPHLLFYAYIPIALVSILLSLFILVKDHFSLRSRLLFGISLVFSIWIINILVQWIASYHAILLFAWEMTAIIEISFYVLCLYFFLVYAGSKDIPGHMKWLLALPVLITTFLTPSELNVAQYDIYNCEGVVGYLWYGLYYFVEPLVILLIAIFGLRHILKLRNGIQKERLQILLTTAGLVLFLGIFWLSNVAGELTKTYEINLVGPLGMVIFLFLLTYQIVKLEAFRVKIYATEAFVGALCVLVFAILFVQEIENVRYIVLITFGLTLLLGILLVKSVRREISQRQRIEQLAQSLSAANERLKEVDKMKSEFVSIASHQLRSPLTAIRGYASMLLEGSYGKLTKKAEEAIKRIQESSRYMALSVEDYLNVSRIEAGNMKYELSKFDLRAETEKVADEVRPTVESKGLVLHYESRCQGSCIVNADIGKTRQVIQNLIDNAMKYTPGGAIKIITHDDPKQKKIFVTIEDTGVGMSKETIENLFDKFVRAKNANRVNVTGTGLGLFVAKKMIEDMGGRIWAESEGEERGSRFHVEFPAV